tara:strand:- start:2399 stop:3253 length:855 start_codon:yes stop_codon:yes gene_type:complete
MILENPRSLLGRSILVTGGSRGLGREMAMVLVEAGADVIISGRRDSCALAETYDELKKLAKGLGGSQKVYQCVADLTDHYACEALVVKAIKSFGKLDVLINNAGLGMRQVAENFNTEPTRFWDASPEDWCSIMDTNVNGPFFTTRIAAKHMVSRGSGKIINISTSAQTMVRQGYAPYGPSKAALEAASRIWSQDLQNTGVTVNVYLPGGASDTDFIPGGVDRRGADGNLLPASIMRRGAVWLCSALSDGVTGGRFTARAWDTTETSQVAAAGARSKSCDIPVIM